MAPGPPAAARPTPEAQPAPGPRPWWSRHRGPLAVGGIGVALGAVAIGVGASTWSTYQDLAASCGGTATGCAQDDIDGAERKALATNLLLGAAGVAVATSVVLFVTERTGEAATSVALLPGPRGATLAIRF